MLAFPNPTRASGFFFSALPMKLRGGSAGWVRPVAMVPESHFSASPETETPDTETGDAR